jgi:uncharacterized protein
MDNKLSEKDHSFLLNLARQMIRSAVMKLPFPEISTSDLSPALKEKGATFVTLTINGNLRGCIGSLEAYQPLVEDVKEHAVQSALEDFRFPPVSADEIPQLSIEISRLTPTSTLHYDKPLDLPAKLRPMIDGVILKDGFKKATFLPQVWDQLPDAEEFLSHLCSKMGSSPDLWKRKMLDVSIYQVEEFQED